MNRRRLRSRHYIEGDRLVRVANQGTHFEISDTGIERVTERGRWDAPDPKGACVFNASTGEPVGVLSRLRCRAAARARRP